MTPLFPVQGCAKSRSFASKTSGETSADAESLAEASRHLALDAPSDVEMSPPTPEALEMPGSDVTIADVTNGHDGLQSVCQK